MTRGDGVTRGGGVTGGRTGQANRLPQPQESPSLMGEGCPRLLTAVPARGASAGGPLPSHPPRTPAFSSLKVASVLSAGRRVFISERSLNPRGTPK